MTAGFGGHFLHVGQCWGASVFLISLISWGRSHPNLTEEEETGEETAKEGAWALLVCAKPWLQPSASGLPWLLPLAPPPPSPHKHLILLAPSPPPPRDFSLGCSSCGALGRLGAKFLKRSKRSFRCCSSCLPSAEEVSRVWGAGGQ